MTENQLKHAIHEKRCTQAWISAIEGGFCISALLTDWPTPIPVSGSNRVIRKYRSERDAMNVFHCSVFVNSKVKVSLPPIQIINS